MARSGINKVILVGNLGQDPEVRAMPNGDASCSLSIATSDSWKDKQTGEQRDKTEWHRVVAFRRLAEIMGEYLRKGSKVYIEGRLQTRKWKDQQGVDRYTTEILANEMQMLDTRANAGQPQNNAPMQQQTPAQAPAQNAPQQSAPAQQHAHQKPQNIDDDSIPF